MKNYIYFMAIVFMLSSVCAQEEMGQQLGSELHRFYVGLDAFVNHSKVKFNFEKSSLAVTSDTIFEGFRFGYDYLKPDAFYFGADGLVAMGKGSVRHAYWSTLYPHQVNRKFKHSSLFTNIEQRSGYSFQPPHAAKSILILFAGIGWYYIRPQFDHNYSLENWLYSAAGLRIIQGFCNFDIGCNLKAMYAFLGRMISPTQVKEDVRNTWGYEVALLLTWDVKALKKWDLQLQPYLLKLDIHSLASIWGARLQAGYRF